MKNDNWSRDTDDFSSAPSCLLHNSSDFSSHISFLSAFIFYCLTRKQQFHTCFLLTVTELTPKKRQHGPNFPFFLFLLLFWCMNILFTISFKKPLYFQHTAPMNLCMCMSCVSLWALSFAILPSAACQRQWCVTCPTGRSVIHGVLLWREVQTWITHLSKTSTKIRCSRRRSMMWWRLLGYIWGKWMRRWNKGQKKYNF